MSEKPHPTRRRGALVNARQDVAEGRSWRAIGRLRDRLKNVGYEDGIVRELGAIHLQIGDECAAGRWWLLSSAEGDDVTRCVNRYLAAFAGDVVAALEAAPSAARKCPVEKLPPIALERVRALGFPIPIDGAQTLTRAPAERAGSRWSTWLHGAGC